MTLLDLKLDSPELLERELDGGPTLAVALDELCAARPELHGELLSRASEWPLGWLNLPSGAQLAEDVNETALRLLDGGARALIVCGIGGSALGAQAVHSALDLPGRPLRPLLFVDNADPAQMAQLLDWADLGQCALNVISKSGETLETMVAFSHILGRMQADSQDAAVLNARVVATTDSQRGFLHDWALANGIAQLPVPGDVGGRFSVLSAVGLLPLAFAGVDIESLLAGARLYQDHLAGLPQRDNPAWQLAALHYLLHSRGGISQSVQYIYGDPLTLLGDWWRQLWAESIAKALRLDGAASGVCQTPLVARGSTDQHSQNQLFMEGPDDKLYTFISCADWPADPVLLPAPGSLPAGLASLAGRPFSELLSACLSGTRDALREAGRPVVEISFPRLGPHELGAYLQLWMLATAYGGLFYGVQPFDQPGVERSKQLTNKALGL